MTYREKRFRIEKDVSGETYRIVENRGRNASGVIRQTGVPNKKEAEKRVRIMEHGRA